MLAKQNGKSVDENYPDAEAQLPDRDILTCRYFKKGRKNLTDGIQTFHCEHGFCVGYVVLNKVESAQIVHDFFYCRCNSGWLKCMYNLL